MSLIYQVVCPHFWEQVYQEQNWNSLVTETKTRIQSRIRRAQLIQLVDDAPRRYQDARDLLLNALPEVDHLLADVKAAIVLHEERGRKIIAEAAARRREQKGVEVSPENQITPSKGKAEIMDDSDSADDSEDDGLPRTQLGDEHRARQRNLLGRLREVYVLQHKGKPKHIKYPT